MDRDDQKPTKIEEIRPHKGPALLCVGDTVLVQLGDREAMELARSIVAQNIQM